MTKQDRGWPAYLLGGRVRTSTLALILAFALVWWLYQEYKPAPQPVQVPATEVVPPGFVPDPSYTWVPRTNVEPNVQEPRTTTTTTATPTTTGTTSPTESTTPSSTTTSGSPTGTTTSGSPTTSATSSTTATTSPPPGAPPSAVPGPGPSPTPSR